MTDPARIPQDVKRDLAAVIRLLPHLAADYTWGFGYAYGPSQGGSIAGTGGGKGGRDQVAYSDSTGNTATTAAEDEGRMAEARKLLEGVDEDVAEALRLLRNANVRLHKRFGVRARDRMYLADPGQVISSRELAAAREAQARRASRGEGFGDG